MPQSLVSIILPTYKHEQYVQETLRAAINQTYSNVEILVLDDGSPDDTWEKVLELKIPCEQRFKRVVMQRQKNKGVCSAYNTLLSMAKGKYVLVLNSDDVLKNDAVETLVSFLDSHDEYVAAVGNNDLIDENGVKIYWNATQKTLYEDGLDSYATFKDFFYSKSIDFLSDMFASYNTLIKKNNHVPNGYLIRKETFDLIGGYSDKAPIEDYYLFLQIAKYGKVKYIDNILLSYRWHKLNTIKLREKTYRFKDRTLAYEKKIVDACKDENIKKYFYEYINKRRYIINFSPVFSFYKVKNMMYKKFFVELFGKSIEIFSIDRKLID